MQQPAAPPTHRPAPRTSAVKHRQPPKLASASGKPFVPQAPWVEYWATSTWPNWTPARPNAPGAAVSYNEHEAARAGIRLMPDQGALIAGLKARIVELEARTQKIDSTLRLQSQVKMLRAENKRLREEVAQPHVVEMAQDMQLVKSVVVPDPSKLVFEVRVSGREYKFRAPDKEALDYWVKGLRARIPKNV